MTYPIFRTLLVAFLWSSVAALVFWTSMRPSRGTSRLGMRGLKRQQSLLRKPLWASVEPFVRWMAARVGPLASDRLRVRLDDQLTQAGDFLGMSADEFLASIVTSGLLGGFGAGVAVALAGYQLGALPWTLGAIVGGAVPWFIVDSARVERFRAINRGLPYAIDMMSLSMSAGLDFPSSVHQVVEKAKANEALREELSYFLQQLQLGTTRVHALREMTSRTPIDCVFEFAQALTQAEERGNPVAAVLEIQAASARIRRSNAAEKAAASMKARMVLPSMIMVGIGLAMVAVPSAMMIDRFTGSMMGGIIK